MNYVQEEFDNSISSLLSVCGPLCVFLCRFCHSYNSFLKSRGSAAFERLTAHLIGIVKTEVLKFIDVSGLPFYTDMISFNLSNNFDRTTAFRNRFGRCEFKHTRTLSLTSHVSNEFESVSERCRLILWHIEWNVMSALLNILDVCLQSLKFRHVIHSKR